ncbi:MAG: hypothetical protein CVU50_08235 [Candidatus Cloacimonetes bacterium HGW-Cloacimonetes-3]|nr:MAG: hypothetical protein CVU50_08235 [Candidatus Cloacimonetes bacterium HGW-Cloacimonetes-3]
MKQLTIIIVFALLFGILSAVDFDFSGQFRTRAAFRNSMTEDDGGSIDNRFQIGLDSEIEEGLNFHAFFEIGDITWGGSGGGLNTNGVNVKTSELYVDYLIKAIGTRVRAGQQYWADHRSLILDDYFSGVILCKEDFAGMKAELGMMKVAENAVFIKDDYNVFMASLQGESPVPFGVLAMGGYLADSNNGNVTIMPYVTMQAGLATLDVTPFFDYQMYPGDNDEIGMGAAVKADADLGTMQLGADVLLAAENGLTSLSPWYQNGLYIYGIGANHDGLNLYWGTPYSYNTDAFVSAVGKIRLPVKENLTAFGAAGMLTDMGWEVNGGLEMNLAQDKMKVSAYGAFGTSTVGAKPTNYAIGTSLVLNF